MRKKKTSSPVRKTAASTVERADGYRDVLDGLTQLIVQSRRRAASLVNRELLLLYWQIGAVVVAQQRSAKWGDSVVDTLATDLLSAFPEMKGFRRDNIFRMRQFVMAMAEVDGWLHSNTTQALDDKGVTADEGCRTDRA